MLLVNAVCAVALVGSVLAALAPGVRRRMRGPLLVLSLSSLVWVVGAQLRSMAEHENVVILSIVGPAVAATAGAGYLLVKRLIDVGERQNPALIAAMVVVPVVIGVASWNQWTFANVDDFRASPAFMMHAAYSFGMLALMMMTLTKRQNDPSARVRQYIRIIQGMLLLVIVLEVAVLPYTHLVVTVIVVAATYIVHKPEIWWNAPTGADELLDAIGVFLFVFDDEGRLLKWNSAASRLVEAAHPGTQLHRGALMENVLESPSVLSDGAILEFDIGGGVLRTICHTHDIETPHMDDRSENVIMLRPLKSPIHSSAFSTPSGLLDGYDPATQTLSRRSILDRVENSRAAVRIELRPTSAGVLADEAVFVVARRVEATFEGTDWGRVDDWTLVTAATPETADLLVRSFDDHRTPSFVDGLSVLRTVHVVLREESEDGADFAARVGAPSARAQTSDSAESL